MATNLSVSRYTSPILSALKGQGIVIKESLAFDAPPLPKDITSVDDVFLMDLYSKYLENYNFIVTQVACADIDIDSIKHELDVLEATMLLRLSDDFPKSTATQLKAMITTDKVVAELRTELLHVTAYNKLLKTIQESMERGYQLASRELTRRNSTRRGF